MFDQAFYQTVFQALHGILRNNISVLGQDFCNRLLFDYDVSKGPQSQNHAQSLLTWLGQETQRINGTNQIQGEQQLFQMLGGFVETMFGNYRQQTNRFGGGQPAQSRFGNGFNNNNMGMPMNQGFGMAQQTNGLSGGSYLDDNISAPQPPQPQRMTQPAPQAPVASKITVPQTSWSDNPLDEVKDADFTAVKAGPNWGVEKPRDNRIVVAKHDEMKSRQGFVIHRFDGYHQVIQHDPLQVAKDFFEVVPDSTLAMPFLFGITYNHLNVIEVPSKDFQIIRAKCTDSLADHSDTPLHKHISQVLNTMQRGPWKAITSYLVEQVNRALYLACRLSTQPKLMISIDDYEDLDTLLSSTFQHPFTTHPDGRHALERIVDAALWNALVMNTSALFTDGEVPTSAMQMSPAFPFSMDKVYPNKYAIPTSDDPAMGQFKENLQTHELAHRTYVVSKRSVVITNILGKNVLPKINRDATPIDSPIARILGNYALPFTKVELVVNEAGSANNNFLSEAYPADQLENYYTNSDWSGEEADRFARIRPVTLPVDRTLFAIQYGVKPGKYLQGLDVLSTFDNPPDKPLPLLAKHAYSRITPLA